jgi:hypothetical protein
VWIALSAVLLASPAAQRVERLARHDLAAKLAVEERKIATKSVKPTTWPDASLGCPEAGKMYAQMETPGFVIELAAGGKTYRYHADHKRVVTCDQPL